MQYSKLQNFVVGGGSLGMSTRSPYFLYRYGPGVFTCTTNMPRAMFPAYHNNMPSLFITHTIEIFLPFRKFLCINENNNEAFIVNGSIRR